MKEVIVKFNFDPETELVSNIVCSIDGVEKKKKTTKKVKELIDDLATEAKITLETNKLVFNSKAVSEMNISYEDRLVIKWVKEKEKMVPVIGKDISFDEEGTGNKLTKSNTITYRGKANTVLAEFGSEFTLKDRSDGIWQLVSDKITSKNMDTVQEEVSKIEPDLLVDSDSNDEIIMEFTL